MSSGQHGLLAQFADSAALLRAVRALRGLGYRRLEAYSPYAIEGLVAALEDRPAPFYRRIAFWVLMGGICGGFGTLTLEDYSAVVSYPVDIGGRPDASWPAFLPAAVEMTLLFAAICGVVAMLVGNGLPRLHHPLFALARFESASRDGLFVLVRGDDIKYHPQDTWRDLASLDAVHVEAVPP